MNTNVAVAPAPKREVNALLGKGASFEGKLTFEGAVRIDGRFAGEIFSQDTLIVGEDGKVRAEIAVATVVIQGEVIGNIKASSSVELRTPGRLTGNIQTPALLIEKGAIFEGNCKMEKAASERRPAVAPVPSPAEA